MTYCQNNLRGSKLTLIVFRKTQPWYWARVVSYACDTEFFSFSLSFSNCLCSMTLVKSKNHIRRCAIRVAALKPEVPLSSVATPRRTCEQVACCAEIA